jgi:hypothetical protein
MMNHWKWCGVFMQPAVQHGMCGGKSPDISIQEGNHLSWHGFNLPYSFPAAKAEPQKSERNDFISQPVFCRDNLPAPVSKRWTSCNV